ncbi:hypothetical protein SPRG_00376 [Saprolegnia parasitica CBS 223.65]|uniref:LNR domain-containing protein n=1 Tax=Saprolegnia parasitica (strain CBS 223.65) TaxID=695850 RepID=A0A067D201_SAPPC|nr:hypothetical protein SPRG_00376 [Saprolegnia parasitica CBS 223.65]KDO35530.1 hypothetical protein SPRG_00376 [Saprolegnia parasitica CBS 223.65]|eukprot:XP_012193865.1 hypothetical protein SPRG_00376 [Saprolegnia parasitica CBS 223.65]
MTRVNVLLTLAACVLVTTCALAASDDSTIGGGAIDPAYGPIDAVYTWVNGSDPAWRIAKAQWHHQWLNALHGGPMKASPTAKDAASTDNRYRDNDELRYSIRSLYQYAPWIRHIYIVTYDQVPTWLDMANPHVTIVPHSTFFANASHLPTFSSPAIEANLDRIPGLSEYFLYFNDEMFLGAPVTPEDFMGRDGTQNVYPAWEIPYCNHMCGNWLLGNGVCDRACNTESCAFDHGDCTCTNAEMPVVANDWKESCQLPERQSTTTANVCAPGCDWNLLGDGQCQAHCNFAECAFDAGDCGDKTAVGLLPHARLDASVADAAVLVDPSSFVLVLDDVTAAALDAPSALVLHTAISQSKLFVFFAVNSSETTAVKVTLANGSTVRLQLVPHGIALNGTGYAVGLPPPSLGAAASVSPAFEPTQLAATIYIPFALLPDWTSETAFRVNDGAAVTCPVVDAASLIDVGSDSYCALNTTGVLLHARPGAVANARVCFTNGGKSGCIEYSSVTVVAPTVVDTKYLLPKTKHECHWWEWCNATYPTLADRCTTPSTKNLTARDPAGAEAKAMTLCTRFGADLVHGPFTADATQPLFEKMCRIMNTTDEDPFWLHGCSQPIVMLPVDDAAKSSMDAFGYSLMFVNKIYDQVFGKASLPRRVPSHTPYFIQKRFLTELKAHWPAEFNATSSHRFRHPKDMQFSFSYMHYVMNRHLLHPPSSTREVFANLIDINQNGRLDDFEEPNVLAIVPEASHAPVRTLLDACRRAANDSSSLTLADITAHCPGLERRLSQTNRSRPTHHLMTEEQVTFLMLAESRGAYGQLHRAWSRPTKFVCVNDDMHNPTPAFHKMLQIFLQLRWSTPSPMELTADASNDTTVSHARPWVKPHWAEPRFKAMRQLSHDVEWGALWSYQLLVVMVSSGTLFYLSMYQRWRSSSRAKSLDKKLSE